jgi:DNA mismatch repair protein MutL
MPRNEVALLPAEVSRRIAAGEVIEKPASVVRELVDNSLDAGASAVDLAWESGGSEEIRVRDNGSGMTRQDLELCWKPHATSKIRTLEDLDHARSLGFRGEALASVAAVSELTIESTTPDASTGHRLEVRHARLEGITVAPPRPGTTVTVRRLFANLPARRRFLSRAQAETRAIRNTVLEKALPFPTVRFTLPGPGKTEQVLPPQSLVERTALVLGDSCPAQSLTELTGSGEGFFCTVIAAHPEVVRRDRRLIHVYVNRRRVWEYRFVQAVEYAYQDVQHGGVFPAAAVFIDVDPELADFNIHPAKREVRLRNAGEIHHRIVTILRTHLHAFAVRAATWEPRERELDTWDLSATEGGGKGAGSHTWEWPAGAGRARNESVEAGRARNEPVGEGRTRYEPVEAGRARNEHSGEEPGGSPRPRRSSIGAGRSSGPPVSFRHDLPAVPPHVAEVSPRGQTEDDHAPKSAASAAPLHFHGTVFGTFSLVERGDRLYIIDQHAAHERLLYDRLAADRTPQVLLVAEEFEVTRDQDQLLEAHRNEYGELGVRIERSGDRRWQITAIPAEYRFQVETLIEAILELEGLHESFDRQVLAGIACKAAMKAGDYLDGLSGVELARRVLALPEPRCPHGRPLWVELDRDQLERLIGRKK